VQYRVCEITQHWWVTKKCMHKTDQATVVFWNKMIYHEGKMTSENFYSKTFKKNKTAKIAFSFLSILLLSACAFSQQANADTTTNGNYSIDVRNIDTNPQPTQTPQKSAAQVLGLQSPKPEYTTGPDYTVNTSNDTFSLNLSQNIIDYGILTSTNPVIRTSALSISNPINGAEILTYENHPLQDATNDVVQNTTCDNGSCSQDIAASWTNTLTYGFGYRCDASGDIACDDQFNESDYYKNYPNDSISQQPSLLVSRGERNSNDKATLTYKVNISGTQKNDGYNNTITYLAVPGF